MDSVIESVDRDPVHSGSVYVLDTNVLKFLYYPPLSDESKPHVESYSGFLRLALERNCSLLICPEVLSELHNLIVRDGYERAKPRGDDAQVMSRKDFRGTEAGRKYYGDARDVITAVLSAHDFAAVPWDADKCAEVVDGLAHAPGDWVDRALVVLAQHKRAAIVTHDGDFAGAGVDVLTANQRLLRA